VLSVRPEDIHLSESRPQGENVWQGTVDQKVFLGESADFQVAVGERRLQSRVIRHCARGWASQSSCASIRKNASR